MAYVHITDNTATNVMTGPVRRAIIQVNAALTGTISVYDSTTTTSPVVAVITNPGVGNKYEYWNLVSGFRVTASGTCDITCSADGSFGPH
jgi:hypothetical protein